RKKAERALEEGLYRIERVELEIGPQQDTPAPGYGIDDEAKLMDTARQNELQPFQLAQPVAPRRHSRLKTGNQDKPLGKQFHMAAADAAARLVRERQVEPVAV